MDVGALSDPNHWPQDQWDYSAEGGDGGIDWGMNQLGWNQQEQWMGGGGVGAMGKGKSIGKGASSKGPPHFTFQFNQYNEIICIYDNYFNKYVMTTLYLYMKKVNIIVNWAKFAILLTNLLIMYFSPIIS